MPKDAEAQSTEGQNTEETVEEVQDEPTDETVKDPDENESEQTESTDPDESAEEGEDDQIDEELTDEAGNEPDELAQLREEVKALKESKTAPAPQVEKTEEQKIQEAEKHGFNDYRQMDYVNQSLQGLGLAVKQYIDQHLGDLRKGGIFQDFSKQKGFQDAESYRGGMDQYMEKYAKGQQPSKDLMEAAYFFAKGKGANKTVTKALGNREKNRKILTVVKPNGTASSKGKTPAKAVKLTPIQRSAAKAAGMSDMEYAGLLKR